MITVFIRTLIVFAVLMSVMRIMGKRQIGELETSEFVTTLLLSELSAYPITDTEIPILYAVIPPLTLLCIEIAISFFMAKFQPVRTAFDGKPSILISNGKVCQKELLRLRMGMGELMSEIRLQGIFSLSDVRYAISEPNGKISVLPYENKCPPSADDLKISVPKSGVMWGIIVDGNLNKELLKKLGKNEEWLDAALRSAHIGKRRQVFYFGVDDDAKTLIIKKE
ncbi:MAG: DUF421 domain-containing protein [Clostridia bacterium]|nr:DUF421 domain-containing protein [Clostridia bacterium]